MEIKKGTRLNRVPLAAGEGFEPSHTESESAVLPLHNPAMFLTNKIYYTRFPAFVNTFFALLEKIFQGRHTPALEGKGRGQRQAASRSADMKYLRRGLYSRANTTRHRMMLGSM